MFASIEIYVLSPCRLVPPGSKDKSLLCCVFPSNCPQETPQTSRYNFFSMARKEPHRGISPGKNREKRRRSFCFIHGGQSQAERYIHTRATMHISCARPDKTEAPHARTHWGTVCVMNPQRRNAQCKKGGQQCRLPGERASELCCVERKKQYDFFFRVCWRRKKKKLWLANQASVKEGVKLFGEERRKEEWLSFPISFFFLLRESDDACSWHDSWLHSWFKGWMCARFVHQNEWNKLPLLSHEISLN